MRQGTHKHFLDEMKKITCISRVILSEAKNLYAYT